MNNYVTGAMIRRLREKKNMTQAELAEKICVSDKSVSKWETGRGYPDISLLESLSAALGISVLELLSGENVINTNRSANPLRQKWYVCPVCGNIVNALGEALVSCCGLTLSPLEPEEPDEAHRARVEKAEDEYYVTIPHEMIREHYISFLVSVTDRGQEFIKLYPEEEAAGRIRIRGAECLYYYCNRHGLFRMKL